VRGKRDIGNFSLLIVRWRQLRLALSFFPLLGFATRTHWDPNLQSPPSLHLTNHKCVFPSEMIWRLADWCHFPYLATGLGRFPILYSSSNFIGMILSVWSHIINMLPWTCAGVTSCVMPISPYHGGWGEPTTLLF
jgi:hypothetical protein